MDIRALSFGRGMGWLTEGFALFRRNPLIWIVLTLAYLALTTIISLIPLIGAVALTLVQPILAAGFMAGCQDLADGEELRVEHLFEGFRRDTQPLLMVGLLTLAAGIGVTLISGAILLVFGGAGLLAGSMSDGGSLVGSLMTASGMLLATLVFFALILPVAMASWFAPALVWFDGLPALEAMKQSLVGCWRNMLPFTLYGLALIPLSLLALLPLGLGLFVLIPTLFASVYVSYRDIYSGAQA
ncbi:BPSS1780 family membrane protein [Methylomagnum sp.]